jgi:hypothetical protein
MVIKNHYDYLDKYFKTFFMLAMENTKTIYTNLEGAQAGLISAHGDKCYSYKNFWEQKGISFYHGTAIYLMTYVNPFSETVRQTRSYLPEGGHIDSWVAPDEWVVANYEKFKPFLLQAEGK